ncbi:NHL repeat-containing protein 2 isoform X2 [Cylas formicarius]|nr:NHL repeat-containing protein 2 isoform X2 [Cylas formicarius]
MDMEVDENYLYYSHEKLLRFIDIHGDQEGITEYLRTVKYASVKDFKPGLEWFNVSEPLSFSKHLKGKIVILDFFTYCCINCMHIIPDLKEIENEFSVEDGLVVIGVHSAKFENEKNSENILAAVQRYNITHPVVNDSDSDMWQNCDVHCWPTLLILGPNGNPIVMLTGEGHKEDLQSYVKGALEYYNKEKLISNHKLPFKSAYHLLPDLKGPLLFPGKITNYIDENGHETLAISDTGNNRILIVDSDGNITKVIGGMRLGFKDGNLEDAEFNNPQGLTFQSKDVLYVADTENHSIRRIDLATGTVDTVAGTGRQGHDKTGGKPGKQQAISSPWDLVLYRTPDMDLTFHPDGKPPVRDVLIIAMAGTHQIWALFLDDTVWWKCKKYLAGTCINIAGSGREENRNNNYPHAAAFAQPSGLALCEKKRELYIADSESSSIRRLSLVDGKVTPVVGGDRNPNNLFAFGDKDGILHEAKLQHALGVAVTPDERNLFIADTYNHKLKKVDLSENKIVTLKSAASDMTDSATSQFREPAGLCVSSNGKKLYVADTNAHQIKLVTIGKNSINNVEMFSLKLKEKFVNTVSSISTASVLTARELKINTSGGKLVLKCNLKFENGLGLNSEGVQRWVINLPEPTWSCVPKNGQDVKMMDTVISVPPHKNNNNIDVSFNLVTCTTNACLPKNFIVRIPVFFENSASINVERVVDVVLDTNNIRIG